MNIPFKLIKLKNNQINTNSYYQQIFAKKLLQVSKNKKSKKVFPSSIDSNELHKQEKKREIIDWFYNLDSKEKVKACSIQNKYIVNMFNHLFNYYLFDDGITFQPSSDNIYFYSGNNISKDLINDNYQNYYNSLDNYANGNKKLLEELMPHIPKNCQLVSENKQYYNSYPFIDEEEEFYSNLFKGIRETSEVLTPLERQQKEIERNFIDNITYISIDEYNDTLSINEFFLQNSITFLSVMENFSNNNFLNDWILPVYDEEYKIYKFPFPKWTKNINKFTIMQLLTCHFEQVILLNYEYYYYTNKMYDFPYFKKIDDIYECNYKIEEYISKEASSNKKKFFDSIDYKKIGENVEQDDLFFSVIKKNKENKDKLLNRLFGNNNFKETTSNPTIDNLMKDAIQKMRVNFMNSFEGFINNIIFVKINDTFSGYDFIFRNTYKYLDELTTNKSAEYLMNNLDIFNENVNKKHNKKKKKKSGNNNNNFKNITNNTTISSISNINICSQKDDIILNNNEQNKNTICEDMVNIYEDNNNTNSIINNNIICEKIYKNEIAQNLTKNNKKKKNDNFFLYPIKSKKKKKQMEAMQSKKENLQKIEIKREEELNEKNNESKLESKLSIKVNEKEDIKEPKEEKYDKSFSQNIITNNTSQIEDNAYQSNSEIHTISENKTSINSPSEKFTQCETDINTSNLDKKEEENNINNNTNNTITNTIMNSISNTNTNLINIANNDLPNQEIFANIYYDILKNLYMYYPTDSFFEKLSREIIQNCFEVKNNLNILKEYRINYLSKIENLILQSLSYKYSIELLHYGSYATDLSVENSDIDLLIVYKIKENISNSNSNDIDMIIKEMVDSISKYQNLFDFVTPIYTATVPVIKLQCDISENIPLHVLNKLKENYLFPIEELIKVKFDITFINSESFNKRNQPQLKSVEFVNNSLNTYPYIKPIFLILKRYFKKLKLNNCFIGGLSSYSLFMLLYSFFKTKKNMCNFSSIYQTNLLVYGRELYNFLEWYSYFNFNDFIIDPTNDVNCFISGKGSEKSIVILDPFSKCNISRSSFKVDEIKNSIITALNLLKFISLRGESYYSNNGNVILKELFNLK